MAHQARRSFDLEISPSPSLRAEIQQLPAASRYSTTVIQPPMVGSPILGVQLKWGTHAFLYRPCSPLPTCWSCVPAACRLCREAWRDETGRQSTQQHAGVIPPGSVNCESVVLFLPHLELFGTRLIETGRACVVVTNCADMTNSRVGDGWS
jgi:hypothetical protein